MKILLNVTPPVIAIAAILTFYSALLHLTRSHIDRSHIFRIVRDMVVGTITVQLYFLSRGLQLQHPFLLFPFITLLFISGPLNNIRYFLFLYPGKKIPLRYKMLLMPAVFILAWEIWFYFINASKNTAALQDVFKDPVHSIVTYIIALGVIVTLIQYGMLVRMELGFSKKEQTKAPFILSSTLMIIYMLDILLIFIGFLFSNQSWLLGGILFMGITGITYLFFENRYPDFYQLVAREEREKKYKRSLIQGLSKEKIITRLQELMEVEKLYRDEELKLEDVAARLLITPHQCSEFVNDCVGKNFSSYVNQFRVNEAKELLLENPVQSTLSIGFDVGFGSKQSFNTIFKQQTGMTPSEYRKTTKPKNG